LNQTCLYCGNLTYLGDCLTCPTYYFNNATNSCISCSGAISNKTCLCNSYFFSTNLCYTC
jgi:hypothetical protein